MKTQVKSLSCFLILYVSSLESETISLFNLTFDRNIFSEEFSTLHFVQFKLVADDFIIGSLQSLPKSIDSEMVLYN